MLFVISLISRNLNPILASGPVWLQITSPSTVTGSTENGVKNFNVRTLPSGAGSEQSTDTPVSDRSKVETQYIPSLPSNQQLMSTVIRPHLFSMAFFLQANEESLVNNSMSGNFLTLMIYSSIMFAHCKYNIFSGMNLDSKNKRKTLHQLIE
jgi:hypothetical protein